MPSRGGLTRRISRPFLLQAAAISLAAALGVYFAALVLEEVLIKQALREEADYYWRQAEIDPGFPLPDTRNLTAYRAAAGATQDLPPYIRDLDPGFHELADVPDFNTVFIDQRDDVRLYLVFDGQRVNQLALYFGLVPLAVVLTVLYLSVWLAYKASHRAVSPIISLTREVNRLDPQAPDPSVFESEALTNDPDDEVQVLASALARFAERLNAFVERERNFTRDASHELRSPLTVIGIAADLLMAEQELSPPAQNSVLRIKRAASDMEELVEAFLLLARESDQGVTLEAVCVNDVVSEEIERARLLARDKPVEVESSAECRMLTVASDKVLSILIGNVLRNAFSYTDVGRVTVTIGQHQLVIEDSGIGMDAQQVEQAFKPYFRGEPQRRGGHGVGLTIVKRLSDRFGWPVDIASEPGVGTRVTIRFPTAQCEPLEGAHA
jgi:signal transduction histidine kinase